MVKGPDLYIKLDINLGRLHNVTDKWAMTIDVAVVPTACGLHYQQPRAVTGKDSVGYGGGCMASLKSEGSSMCVCIYLIV
jgi:hypothetical protein